MLDSDLLMASHPSKVRDVVVRYGDTTAVDGVSLSVPRGCSSDLVDGTLVMEISPLSSLKKTKSENVPPVSTVTRYLDIVRSVYHVIFTPSIVRAATKRNFTAGNLYLAGDEC